MHNSDLSIKALLGPPFHATLLHLPALTAHLSLLFLKGSKCSQRAVQVDCEIASIAATDAR